MTSSNVVFGLKTFIHLACLCPLINAFYLASTDQFGADPVKAIIHFTGIGGLNILLVSLSITPLVKWFKQPVLMKVRRLTGLYAFSYALLHILSFLAFDLQFDVALFLEELVNRPYIWLGMLAFIVLLMMAITSVSALKRHMGKQWQKLHNWVYLSTVFIAIHFYWSVKSAVFEPIIYLLITLLLLSFRKKKLLRWFRSR